MFPSDPVHRWTREIQPPPSGILFIWGLVLGSFCNRFCAFWAPHRSSWALLVVMVSKGFAGRLPHMPIPAIRHYILLPCVVFGALALPWPWLALGAGPPFAIGELVQHVFVLHARSAMIWCSHRRSRLSCSSKAMMSVRTSCIQAHCKWLLHDCSKQVPGCWLCSVAEVRLPYKC